MTRYLAKPYRKPVYTEESVRSWPERLNADGTSMATGLPEKHQRLHLTSYGMYWLETYWDQKPDIQTMHYTIKAPPPPPGKALILNFDGACAWMRKNANPEGLAEIQSLPVVYGVHIG
jgi:hypothetical protein